MACFHDSPKFEINEEYMTRKSAWEDIKEFIPTDKTIWECFYGNGQSGEYLRQLGFEVIHEPIDFFENNKGDIIVSNPPFSNKDKVFQRLQHECRRGGKYYKRSTTHRIIHKPWYDIE